MNIGLSDVIENVKQGREYALLGNYESSQVHYQGAIQQINRISSQLNDPDRVQQWQEVRSVGLMYRLDVKQTPKTNLKHPNYNVQIQRIVAIEYESVRDLQNILLDFKCDSRHSRLPNHRRDSHSLARSSALSMSMVSINSSGRPYVSPNNQDYWMANSRESSVLCAKNTTE